MEVDPPRVPRPLYLPGIALFPAFVALALIVISLTTLVLFFFYLPSIRTAEHAAVLIRSTWLLGLGALIWTALYALGMVGTTTASGFRLAAVALMAGLASLCMETIGRGVIRGSGEVAIEPMPGLAWLLRHASIFATGYSLGLVSVACAAEIRRRHLPDWIRRSGI